MTSLPLALFEELPNITNWPQAFAYSVGCVCVAFIAWAVCKYVL